MLWLITGLKPSALRDCSTYKFQFTLFLKFESHNNLDMQDPSSYTSAYKKEFLIKKGSTR